MGNVVLVKHPEKLIDLSEFQTVLEKYQGAFGMAAAFDDTIDAQSGQLDFSGGVKSQVDSLNDFQTSYKAAPMIFTFSAESLDAESKQPFIILSDGDKPQIVAFLSSGDYARHAEPNSLHSSAFFAMAKFLRPRLLELARQTKGDTDELVKLFKNDAIVNGIVEGTIGPEHTGSITILTLDGKLLTFSGDKTDGLEKPWGWMSTEPPVRAVDNAKKPMLKLPEEVGPQATAAKERPKFTMVSESQVSIQTGADINKNIAAAGKVVKLVQAKPKSGLANGIVKHLYESYNYSRGVSGRGVIPNRWKERVAVEVDPKWLSHKDFLNSMDLVDEKNQLLSSTSPAALSVAPKTDVSDGIVVLSAEEKQKFLEDLTIKGFINEAGQRSAEDIQKDETLVPKFEDTAKFTLSELKRHTPGSLAYLVNNYPDLAAIALHNALRHLPTATATSQSQPSSVPAAASSPPTVGKSKLRISG